MHQLLYQTQQRAGGWVGSSLIHLGDSNVPNALMFIDKYSQVEHILHPILGTLRALDELHKTGPTGKWIDLAFGGVQALRVTILQDFFRGAFDGSGADNFLDAEAAKHLSEALKTNSTLQTLRYAAARPFPYCQQPLTFPFFSRLQSPEQQHRC